MPFFLSHLHLVHVVVSAEAVGAERESVAALEQAHQVGLRGESAGLGDLGEAERRLPEQEADAFQPPAMDLRR